MKTTCYLANLIGKHAKKNQHKASSIKTSSWLSVDIETYFKHDDRHFKTEGLITYHKNTSPRKT